MPLPERPRLRRRFVECVPDPRDPRFVILLDRLPLCAELVRVTELEFNWLGLFDGQRSLQEVQAEATRQWGGMSVPLNQVVRLAERLDAACLLDGPRFHDRLNGAIREPSCIGCYAGDPRALREQLTALFAGPTGPGLPRPMPPDGRLRAALLPHIDYARGGATFAWGFKEVVEHANASLFVIIGTSHYSPCRFILTRRDFKTPLGIVPTDQPFVDRLVAHYGDGLFDDEIAHFPEHSIELEVVFLQYLYEGLRPIRIVPLLVGPFQDCIEDRASPRRFDDIARMIQALHRAEEETPEPICYLISGDLAHLGPKFGDPSPVRAPFLQQSRAQDHALLRAAADSAEERYFELIAAEGDNRRICGLPPTYVALAAARPGRGRLVHYDQYVHPRGAESVSFASVVFER